MPAHALGGRRRGSRRSLGAAGGAGAFSFGGGAGVRVGETAAAFGGAAPVEEIDGEDASEANDLGDRLSSVSLGSSTGSSSRRLQDSPGSARGLAESAAQIATLGARASSPLSVLHLNKEVLLDDWQRRSVYQVVHLVSRLLPALVIYGGTAGLLVCALCQYRYGVLLALTLFSFYMLHLCLAFFAFAAIGLVRVYIAQKENWQEKYYKHREKSQASRNADERWILDSASDGNTSDGRELRELGWRDVIHVVMLPSYRTPQAVLVDTLQALAQFRSARTNLAVCLAFEEREAESTDKATFLREEFEHQFRFVLATFHPPSLPNHIPGKSSNECWAFFQLCRELDQSHQIGSFDPRVLITVIDDDSQLHENYFDALTYHFLITDERDRYLSAWQPPICHFKNYLRQPVLVRISSVFATLHELSCLANPIDCHVPYSSYSISLVLAFTVGGWDPEYLAEDWHMFAKCSLMTEGRMRCRPIFLPVLNYTPEANTYCGTLASRWDQAKRHALGVSELVYVISSIYLALLELPTPKRVLSYLWRLAPLLAKFSQVHFVNGMSAIWTGLAQLVIHYYLWRSWCYLSELADASRTCGMAAGMSGGEEGLAEEQILLNSLLVYWQQRATVVMGFCSIMAAGLGAFYLHIVKDRVEGDVEREWSFRHPLVTWLVIELEVSTCGLASSMLYGALPLWIACFRVVQGVRFPHLAASMLGRTSGGEDV